jgi:CBS domain containing-hemolysin-like protein
MTLVDAGQKEGTIDDEEKAMIFSVLQFGETLVREVMVPRMDFVAVEINTPLEVALGRFVESGHSRIPIYDEKIDNVEGVLYAKDVLTMWHNGGAKPQSIRDLMRPAYFVPENNRADLVLKEMQASKIHMAIVVDEYGGTAGIVTIENLIEEIIGDIQDEYDVAEEADYTRHSDTEYTVDGGIDLDDLNELLPIALPTDDHDTLSGYIYGQVGRVPQEGEVIDDPIHRLTLVVKSVEVRRIRKVLLTINGLEMAEPDKPDELPAEEQRDEVG